jgi:hypothetical protein
VSDDGDETAVEVVVPDDPPQLSPAGWRALLRVLVEAAEEEFGPDWRSEIRDRAGCGR